MNSDPNYTGYVDVEQRTPGRYRKFPEEQQSNFDSYGSCQSSSSRQHPSLGSSGDSDYNSSVVDVVELKEIGRVIFLDWGSNFTHIALHT